MKKLSTITAFVIVLLLIGTSIAFTETAELTPENTVIVSNETDKDFCQDFSVFLQRLSLEWVHIKQPGIPDNIKNKNIIIVGGPDALYTGEIVKDILTENEVNLIRHGSMYHTVVKDSPWADNRVVYVCAGSNRIYTKKAAEESIKSIIKKSKKPEKWVYTPIRWSSEQIQQYIAQLQFVPEDEELPADELAIDVSPDTYEFSPKVSSEDAKKDVERLFYLLSHGYCGYGYFKTRGDFDQAKSDILREVETSSTWSLYDFSEVIHTHLQFIGDGHFVIGAHEYYHHKDFWHSWGTEIWKTEGEYYFVSDNMQWEIIKINEDNPEKFMFPSLNPRGEPVYILGVLSSSSPGTLTLKAEDKHGITHSFNRGLSCSHYDPYVGTEKKIFEEKTISEIPVISVRSFRDAYHGEMEAFVQTAEKYRGEPYLILDIRGNGGGNSEWPRRWVETFTGCNPGSYLTYTKFTSRTTLMGQINYWNDTLIYHPNNRIYKGYLQECEEELRMFNESHSKPYWSELQFYSMQLIPNDTRIIVLTDSDIWSSGELFINFLRQVENVVIVGENTVGATVFGWKTLHQLPHSKLRVRCGCALYYPSDLHCIEEEGLFPDLWVPPSDVLDYVITAIQKGIL
ncbi:MAG: hypothetical protein HXS48_13555 [Theionarchaea archaeon]|nr:hypothetical protein [Theionarchaea archaeon]